ncbi:hypothetical protein bthur0014_61440 [Bacillus thuringiensis IBL 4222]|nr:DUF4870 domain-containing protein [Bacillus thuringiensis]EEM99221.1 hypothetical protein bthur0014_61440 [Bacillus thuringiensis IBL 4222]
MRYSITINFYVIVIYSIYINKHNKSHTYRRTLIILTQEKNIKLIMHFLTLLSFCLLIFFSVTIFYIPLIFYFICKSQDIRKNILEAVFYQLFIWVITMIWNLFIIRILMLSLSNLDLTPNNALIIFGIPPLYLILFLLLIFGPIKGILYVLQEKDFHYPIISKWINK